MKELKRVFLVWLIVAFALGLLLFLLVGSWLGKSPDWWETLIISALYGVIYAGGGVGLAYSFIGSRLKFLGSDEREVPPFGWKVVKVIPVETADFSFEVVKYRIRDHYLITYYDDTEQYIVKFRTRFGIRSWGAGGCAVYDPVARTITLSCFSMTAFLEKETRIAQVTADKIETVIRNK